MAVYVDDLFRTQPSIKWPYSYACHLVADTQEELHVFAVEKLGLRRAWFQDHHVNSLLWHYDLTKSKRNLAIQCGAIPLTPEQFSSRIFGASST